MFCILPIWKQNFIFEHKSVFIFRKWLCNACHCPCLPSVAVPLTWHLKLQKWKKKKKKKFSVQVSTKSSTVEEKQVDNMFKSIDNNIIHILWFPWKFHVSMATFLSSSKLKPIIPSTNMWIWGSLILKFERKFLRKWVNLSLLLKT